MTFDLSHLFGLIKKEEMFTREEKTELFLALESIFRDDKTSIAVARNKAIESWVTGFQLIDSIILDRLKTYFEKSSESEEKVIKHLHFQLSEFEIRGNSDRSAILDIKIKDNLEELTYLLLDKLDCISYREAFAAATLRMHQFVIALHRLIQTHIEKMSFLSLVPSSLPSQFALLAVSNKEKK